MTGLFLKDPDSELDYRVDWDAALGSDVTLLSCAWEVEPVEAAGLIVSTSTLVGTEAVVRLGGGRPGHVYRVGGLARFSDGTSDERSLLVRVEER